MLIGSWKYDNLSLALLDSLCVTQDQWIKIRRKGWWVTVRENLKHELCTHLSVKFWAGRLIAVLRHIHPLLVLRTVKRSPSRGWVMTRGMESLMIRENHSCSLNLGNKNTEQKYDKFPFFFFFFLPFQGLLMLSALQRITTQVAWSKNTLWTSASGSLKISLSTLEKGPTMWQP